MAAPEDPPGFVVQQEAKKAAWDNGYRLPKEVSRGGWLRFGSTTARGDIWIATREEIARAYADAFPAPDAS